MNKKMILEVSGAILLMVVGISLLIYGLSSMSNSIDVGIDSFIQNREQEKQELMKECLDTGLNRFECKFRVKELMWG